MNKDEKLNDLIAAGIGALAGDSRLFNSRNLSKIDEGLRCSPE